MTVSFLVLTVCVCVCVRARVCVLVLVLAGRCIFGGVFPQGVWYSPHVGGMTICVCHALMRTTHTHRRPHYLGMAPFGSLGVAVPLL